MQLRSNLVSKERSEQYVAEKGYRVFLSCLSKAARVEAKLFTDIRGHQVPIYYIIRYCIDGNGVMTVVANHSHGIVVFFAIIRANNRWY